MSESIHHVVAWFEARDDFTSKIPDIEGGMARIGASARGTGAELANLGRLAITGYLRMEIAVDALRNAEDRLSLAQDHLRETILKYGAGSNEARRAQQELEISERSLEISQNRLNVRMLFFGLTVIPDVIRGITTLLPLIRSLTGATAAAEVVSAAAYFKIPTSMAALGLGAGSATAVAQAARYFKTSSDVVRQGMGATMGMALPTMGLQGSLIVYANDINVAANNTMDFFGSILRSQGSRLDRSGPVG